LEETLSTLDYAIRAKSIRNRPEINQRTTRNSLLKDYVAEIERLKADLLAAREKNGIFFAEETWAQMVAEQELKATELEEARKQVEIVESKLRGVQDEFEQSIGLLKLREGELHKARDCLQDAQETLVEKQSELTVAQTALQEETVLKEAHQSTEIALDSIATGLKRVAEQSLRDLKNLFDKLGTRNASMDICS
jgi:kinesin family member 11